MAASRTWLEQAREFAALRRAVAAALSGDPAQVEEMLEAEQKRERELDRQYWQPLRQQLEELRRAGPEER